MKKLSQSVVLVFALALLGLSPAMADNNQQKKDCQKQSQPKCQKPAAPKCVKPVPPVPPSTPPPTETTTNTTTNDNTNTNTNVNTSSSNSSSSSSSNSSSRSNSVSSVSNSGNSHQSQTQSTNSSANNNGNGNGNNSNNTYVPRQTATAYAPMIAPTSPCFKGGSIGAQGPAFGLSLGGGKIDQNCAILETARQMAESGNLLAFCKIMLTDKYVKQAGVSLDDCMARQPEPEPVVAPPAPMPAPITINIPAPVMEATPAPKPVPPVVMVKKPVVHHIVHRKPAPKPCAPASEPTQTFVDNGNTYIIPQSMVASFRKDFPNAKELVGSKK